MKQLLLATCLMPAVSIVLTAGEPEGIQADTLSRTTRSWDGEMLPKYAEGVPQITIIKYTIPPRTRLPIHMHPVINAGVLLKGELTVVTDSNETLHLKAGDAVIELVDTWHYGRNDGSVPAEIIVFYAGSEGLPVTVKKETGTTSGR